MKGDRLECLWKFSLKHKFLSVFILGAMASLSFPPVGFFPILFFTFPLFLMFLEQMPKSKSAFWLGWWFGWGHFIAGMYWIVFALGVDIKSFAWLVPFTLFGLPGYLALYPAVVCLLTSFLPFSGFKRILIFALLWSLFEWVRGWLFTGFPWNLLGYSWSQSLSMLQSTALFGVLGLGFFTILWSLLPRIFFDKKAFRKDKVFSFLGLSLMILFWVGGNIRLHDAPKDHVENIYLRLVQPNIAQKEKWNHKNVLPIFQKMITLSSKPSDKPITHVIWPEAAISFFLESDEEARLAIASVAPKNGAVLLGAPRRTYAPQPLQLWNSFFIVSHSGAIMSSYDKSHLVPFGEFVPLRSIVPSFIKKVTAGMVDFSAGEGLRSIDLEGPLPAFSPLICYEGIFPSEVVSKRDKRPEWLLNITNDAWYGPTSGPYQHFEIIRVRAIEEGLPVVRVANTGISGVIDAYGRTEAELGLEKMGVIDADLPKSLNYLTLYAEYGDRTFFALLTTFLGLCFFL